MIEDPKKVTIRFSLDDESGEIFVKALKNLKKDLGDITINKSSFGSFIIKRYLRNKISVIEKKVIQRTFFNERKFIRSALKGNGNLEEALRLLAAKKKMKPYK